MLAGEPNIQMLADWHMNRRSASFTPIAQSPIQIFISFLDAVSLEAALSLRSFLQHRFSANTIAKFADATNIQRPPVDVICFPISKCEIENTELIQRFRAYSAEEIKWNSDDTEPVKQKLLELVNIGSRIIQSNLHQWRISQDRVLPPFRHGVQGKNLKLQEYCQNKYLFGTLAATYLNTITSFPTIMIGDRFFYGIPLGMTICDFLETVFLPEIEAIYSGEICPHIQ